MMTNTVTLKEEFADSDFGLTCELILPKESGTIATREWVQANVSGGGGNIDTSNFVDLTSAQTITGQKTVQGGYNFQVQFATAGGDEWNVWTGCEDDFDANGGSTPGIVVCSPDYTYSSFYMFPNIYGSDLKETIATREWVAANAGGSIDTSNLVTKDDTVLTLKDSDTYEQGWLSLDASNGRITYNPYPGAFWSPNIILDLSAADPSDQEKNATVQFNLPTKPDGIYTLATTDMIGGGSGGSGNYVELGTRPTAYLAANPSQTIYTDINIGDSEASGYASYNLTTWGWYGGYIKLNPGSPAIEVQTPMASTSRNFQFPEAGGILATQNWVAAQIQSQITDTIVNGEW
jgi:hypothetical protein